LHLKVTFQTLLGGEIRRLQIPVHTTLKSLKETLLVLPDSKQSKTMIVENETFEFIVKNSEKDQILKSEEQWKKIVETAQDGRINLFVRSHSLDEKQPKESDKKEIKSSPMNIGPAKLKFLTARQTVGFPKFELPIFNPISLPPIITKKPEKKEIITESMHEEDHDEWILIEEEKKEKKIEKEGRRKEKTKRYVHAHALFVSGGGGGGRRSR